MLPANHEEGEWLIHPGGVRGESGSIPDFMYYRGKAALTSLKNEVLAVIIKNTPLFQNNKNYLHLFLHNSHCLD